MNSSVYLPIDLLGLDSLYAGTQDGEWGTGKRA
jgi:hypothetical protein